MSFLADAADQIDKAATKVQDYAGGLVPGAGGGGGPPKGDLKYRAGETLDPRVGAPQALAMQSEAVGSPSAGATTHNHRAAPLPIEYVHYSRIHADMSDNFDAGDPPRGLAVRDGLLREAVLLHGFVISARDALADKMASNDASSKLLATAGSLLGGDRKHADAGPEVFDPLLDRIHAAVAPIAGASFTFAAVHQAGVDLHEVRSSFDALYKTALKPGSGGGDALPSMSKLPGVGSLGAFGGPVSKIPGYLFRAQATYLGLARAAIEHYMRGVEDVCSAFSVAAIRNGAKPTWPVWFAKNGEAGPQYADADDPDNTGLLDGSGMTAGGWDVFARQKREERRFEQERANQVTDAARRLDTEPATADDCVHKADVQAAIAVLSGGGASQPPAPGANLAQSSGARPAADVTMTRAFAAGVLDENGASLPGFIEVFVGEMSKASTEILGTLLLHLLDRGTAIDKAELPAVTQTATREALAQKLVGIAWDLLHGVLGLSDAGPGQNRQQGLTTSDVRDTAIEKLRNPSSLLGDAQSMGQGAIANKAAQMASQLLTEHSTPLNAVIDFISGDLNKQLSAALDASNANAALTMESFLGRLPLLHATLVRDSTFPVFRLILGLFGDADKLAMGAWNPIGGGDGVLGRAGDAVGNSLDAAHTTRDRLNDLDRRASGLGEGNEVGLGEDNQSVVDKFANYGKDAYDTPGSAIDQLTKNRHPSAPALGADAAKLKAGPLGVARVDGRPRPVTRGDVASADNYDASHQVLVSEVA
jgi:hypothetical protein